MNVRLVPMITLGDWRQQLRAVVWSAASAVGRRTAQFEHTVLVTDDGVDILTHDAGGRPGWE
jgi:methionyl aminopeptidase